METEQPEPAQPPATDRPAPPSPARLPAWAYVLPVLSLVVSVAVWFDLRGDVTTLTRSHRQLAAELDEARGLSTINVKNAPARGSAEQVLTLVEFSDYECPFCIRHFSETMPAIEKNWIQTGRLRYVFQDFPIDQLHPAAIRGHEAARCAGEQGKFWEMHARMFSPAGSHTAPQLETRAAEAGLSMPSFRECITSGRFTSDIQTSVQTAVDLGANGTPAFFVGIRDLSTDDVRIVTSVSGAQPLAAFEKAFAAVTARVK